MVDLGKLAAELRAAGIEVEDKWAGAPKLSVLDFDIWVYGSGDVLVNAEVIVPGSPHWKALDIIRAHVAPVAPAAVDGELRERAMRAAKQCYADFYRKNEEAGIGREGGAPENYFGDKPWLGVVDAVIAVLGPGRAVTDEASIPLKYLNRLRDDLAVGHVRSALGHARYIVDHYADRAAVAAPEAAEEGER